MPVVNPPITPPTRAAFEAILVARCGRAMVAAHLDGTTTDGTNAALADPLAYGIRRAGGSVASFGAPGDADVQTVATGDLDMLADVAEYRLLNTILGNVLDQVTLSAGNLRRALSDQAKSLQARVDRKAADVKAQYGLGAATLAGGVNTLDFVQRGDDPFPVGPDGVDTP